MWVQFMKMGTVRSSCVSLGCLTAYSAVKQPLVSGWAILDRPHVSMMRASPPRGQSLGPLGGEPNPGIRILVQAPPPAAPPRRGGWPLLGLGPGTFPNERPALRTGDIPEGAARRAPALAAQEKLASECLQSPTYMPGALVHVCFLRVVLAVAVSSGQRRWYVHVEGLEKRRQFTVKLHAYL